MDFLLIDDDKAFTAVLCRSLERRGFAVAVAHEDESALRLAEGLQPRHILLDLKLEATSGLNLIAALKSLSPSSDVVMLTGYSSIPTTVEAIKLGAINYLCKPASVDDILDAFNHQGANPDIGVPPTPPSVDRLEWEHIQKVLQDHDGNISATARALGMHRRTLQRKLQKRPVRS